MRNLRSINLTFTKYTLCPVKQYISRVIGYRTVGHVQFETLDSINGHLFPEVDTWRFRTKKHRDQLRIIKLIVPGEVGLYPVYIEVPAKYVKMPGERVFTKGRERPEMMLERANRNTREYSDDIVRLTEHSTQVEPVEINSDLFTGAVVMEPKRGL